MFVSGDRYQQNHTNLALPFCVPEKQPVFMDGGDRDQIVCKIYREYVQLYIVLPISKILNEVGGIDDFRALARKVSFLPTELDIFDIRQHYVLVL